MPDTLEDSLTLEDAQKMDLEKAGRTRLDEAQGDRLYRPNGFQSKRSVDVTRSFATTFQTVTR